MRTKYLLFGFLITIISCSKETVVEDSLNLKEYLTLNSDLVLDEVIACAASGKTNSNTSYIFYYPIEGATEIKYFETEMIDVDSNDFSLYSQKELPSENVFGGYLKRFVKDTSQEVWSMVTYKTNGKIHKSNPIRLKNQSKETEWSNLVTIDASEALMPKFSWNDGEVLENVIYFQVISDAENNLISGTYTTDLWFQYYKLSNVVLNITIGTPMNLIPSNEYNFTLMGVSEDNWVNLVIEKTFIAE